MRKYLGWILWPAVVVLFIWFFTTYNIIVTEHNYGIDSLNSIRDNIQEYRQPLHASAEGWSKSIVDPNGLINYFPALRMKTGYKLVSYQFMEGHNGNGFIWAIPDESDFPEPGQCERVQSGFFADVPKPPGAMDNVMECIEGDGSPLSYLYASLFAREAKEFGAVWHGCKWDTREMLTSEFDHIGKSHYGMLHWPVKLTPRVISGSDTVTVIFYTYSALYEEALYKHVDTYQKGSYIPTSSEKVIARGSRGYCF